MRYVALVLVLLLAVTPAAAGAADTSTSPGPAPDRASGSVYYPADVGTKPARWDPGIANLQAGIRSVQFGTPTVNFTINLRTNRTARWTVAMRYEFSDAADRDAFREFAADFENGRVDGAVSITPFRNAARIASNATGRQMTIRNVDRTSVVRNGSGTLKLSFTWTNFIERTDQGLRLSDAFTTPDNGTWLSALGPNQRLVITPPSGYVVDSSNYRIENQRVVIEGPTRFDGENRIRVSYLRAEDPGTDPVLLAIAGGVVVLLGLIGGYVLLSRRGPRNEGQPAESPTPSPDSNAAAESASESPTAGNGAGADPAEPDGTAGQEDLTLLSDEERVERLLKRNGGRMRQADIVDETGWSDAKVSQLLSAMAEEGRIDKLRLGRENLISLPDEDE